MNPLNKRMIATPKLKGERLAELKKQVLKTKNFLADLEIGQSAKYLVANFPGTKHIYDVSPFLFE